MRKSIYIQFLLVVVALGVLFYVVLFHETTYIEVPSPIGGYSVDEGDVVASLSGDADASGTDEAPLPGSPADQGPGQESEPGSEPPQVPPEDGVVEQPGTGDTPSAGEVRETDYNSTVPKSTESESLYR